MRNFDEQSSPGVILAVTSQKGGVGKTTTTLNLGFTLAQRGWNVLIVDADPQGSIGLSLRRNEESGKGLYECLHQGLAIEDAALTTRLPELSILTFGGEGSIPPWKIIEEIFQPPMLGEFFARAAAKHDVVLVDTAGGTYGLTQAVLRHCNSVLLPLQAEPLALRSVTRTLDAIGQLREEGCDIQIAGFLLTMLSPDDKISALVAQESWKLLPAELILNANVPRDTAFLRASIHGVPIGLLSRRPPRVAAVFDLIAREIERRIGLVQMEESDEPISLFD